MHVELVRTITSDGMRLDGALLAGDETGQPKSADAAICLHGVGANFYTSGTLEAIAPALRKLGLDVLLVNTRGHDSLHSAVMTTGRRRQGAAVEIVDECRLDVAAWIRFVTQRGVRRILLVGHSLGAIKAIYSQAFDGQPDVVSGLIAVSPPRLSYQAFQNSLESSQFFESISTAESLVKEGRGDELFTAKFPFPLLISAGSYLDKYGPAERYNILNFAGRLTCPALVTYGSQELETSIAFAGMPDALKKVPMALGSLDVEIVEGADHNYSGVTENLAGVTTKWIRTQLK